MVKSSNDLKLGTTTDTILTLCLLCEKLTVASLIKLSGTKWKSRIYYIKRNSMKKGNPYDE